MPRRFIATVILLARLVAAIRPTAQGAGSTTRLLPSAFPGHRYLGTASSGLTAGPAGRWVALPDTQGSSRSSRSRSRRSGSGRDSEDDVVSFTMAPPESGAGTDTVVIEAVEEAFRDVEITSFTSQTSTRGAMGGLEASGASSPSSSEEEQRIVDQVATALGIDAEEPMEVSSETLKRVKTLTEQAGLAFLRARDALESARIFIEDRVKRDAAILAATVEYIRQRTVYDSQRLLAAAVEISQPIALLAEAGGPP